MTPNISRLYLINSKTREEPTFSASVQKACKTAGVGFQLCSSDDFSYFFKQNTQNKECHLYLQGMRITPQNSDFFFLRGWRGKKISSVLLSLYLEVFDISNLDARSNTKHDVLNSKLTQPFFVHNTSVRSPNTWLCHANQLSSILTEVKNTLGHEIVLKTRGGMGENVKKISFDQLSDLAKKSYQHGDLAPFYILQEYIPCSHDLRIVVLNEEIITGIKRIGDGFLNNVSQGATATNIDNISEELRLAAVEVSKVLEMELCGVDFVEQNGSFLLLEANKAPGLQSIAAQTGEDYAAVITDKIITGL